MSFLAGGGEEKKRELTELQSNQQNVRNICILAHVDHGKTTLSDSLIASNGIISKRQAGKLRYLDNREDEQLRGITMKSSAIALKFIEDNEKYLINLIDSPGHVDFSSEVSTAVRLCDGALVVVDVVEGVCPQTKVVLEQAWQEGIKPCLVLNKMDRLITHLKITPLEAYGHIEHILQQVNAVTASLWTTEIIQQKQEKEEEEKNGGKTQATVDEDEEVVYNWDSGIGEADDSHVYFSPEQGNVVFASAIDGWGFGVEHFVQLYTRKLGFKEDVLRKTLWGDYYINSKTKRICKGARDKGKKPLFVQFVLENLWTVYDAVIVQKNRSLINKIISSLGLKISARDSIHSDPLVHLSAICSQWLPLATAVLGMVVRILPSPRGLSRERVEKLMCSGNRKIESYPVETQGLVDSFVSCSSDPQAPVIVFISKIFLADLSSVRETQSRKLTLEEMKEKRETIIRNLRSGNDKPNEADGENEEDMETEATPPDSTPHQFLAFSRVFSGTLRKGQKLFVLQPRYDPTLTPKPLLQTTPTQEPDLPLHVTTATVTELYLLMGRDLLEMESVAPGNIAGIGGLGESVIKSGTLSSSLACTSFKELQSVAFPIVHVAIEAVHFSDLPSLDNGLKLLDQSDPCVRCTYQETGERVLSTAGEVHLQRCLDDLRNVYARVEIKVSPPIVPFRETVIAPPTVDMVNEVISSENELISGDDKSHASKKYGPVVCQTPGGNPHMIKILATPLPEAVIDILDKSSRLLKILTSMGGASYHGNEEGVVDGLQRLYSELKNELEAADKKKWGGAVDHIWSFGPRNSGTNILLNRIDSYRRPSIWRGVVNQEVGMALQQNEKCSSEVLRSYDNSIVSGFQLASLSGPLCEEPLRGVCFEVLEWAEPVSEEEAELDTLRGPVSGQLISVVKECCRQAMLSQPARLVAPMYSCIIQAAAGVLGFVYAVIGRRGGRVVSEEMIEGADLFVVQALIPVAESFGFCDEFRKQTIGQANPQLVFSHWEVISSDPFWVPSTEMELEHYGEKADTESQARVYMNSVRKRKGLAVDEKIVEHAEKQRTLKRNK